MSEREQVGVLQLADGAVLAAAVLELWVVLGREPAGGVGALVSFRDVGRAEQEVDAFPAAGEFDALREFELVVVVRGRQRLEFRRPVVEG